MGTNPTLPGDQLLKEQIAVIQTEVLPQRSLRSTKTSMSVGNNIAQHLRRHPKHFIVAMPVISPPLRMVPPMRAWLTAKDAGKLQVV